MNIADDSRAEVEITSLWFKTNPDHQIVESYPLRMVYEGREYTFVEFGMRYLIGKGQELIKLFDVSDGQNQYRLRLDCQRHWSLVDKKALA